MPSLPAIDPDTVELRGTDITPEALAGFLADGDEALTRWALQAALRDAPRAEVYDTFVREAMAVVGQRWRDGRWTISEEHLASRTLTRALVAVAPVESVAERIAPVAILAGVAGEEHSLGLLLLAHVLRESGFAVADLGPNVPADDLVRFASKSQAQLVALTATRADRTDVLRETVAALKALPAPPVVMVGGRIAETAAPPIPGADWTGTSLRDAVRFAESLEPGAGLAR
jgi:methanogenic corrinoid protein MtbC1